MQFKLSISMETSSAALPVQSLSPGLYTMSVYAEAAFQGSSEATAVISMQGTDSSELSNGFSIHTPDGTLVLKSQLITFARTVRVIDDVVTFIMQGPAGTTGSTFAYICAEKLG